MTVTKWATIVVVGLMLLSMFAYVLTDDESIQPTEGENIDVQQPIDAAP